MKKKKEKKSAYEYCLVCKLNHDQGQRHKYFPNHKKSLSAFLSRFEIKLSDVRFFLNTPFRLSPEYASQNRFWCIFCDVQVDENDSSFACSNAIKHLASADHLKNLKHFFWKYGGDVERLDDYRILEADVAKWEKKCKVQSIAASSGLGPTNEMSIRYPIHPIQDPLMFQIWSRFHLIPLFLCMLGHVLVHMYGAQRIYHLVRTTSITNWIVVEHALPMVIPVVRGCT